MIFLQKVLPSLFLLIVLNLTVFQATAQLVTLDVIDYTINDVGSLNEEATGELFVYFPNVTGFKASPGDRYTITIRGTLDGVDSGIKYKANRVIVNIDTPSPVNGAITSRYINRIQIVGRGTVVTIPIEIDPYILNR